MSLGWGTQGMQTEFWWEYSLGKCHLGNWEGVGRITLRWVLWMQVVRRGDGWTWIRIVSNGALWYYQCWTFKFLGYSLIGCFCPFGHLYRLPVPGSMCASFPKCLCCVMLHLFETSSDRSWQEILKTKWQFSWIWLLVGDFAITLHLLCPICAL